MQCRDGFDFFVATQHATFELEIVETVLLAGGFRLAHDGLGSQRNLVPHAKPVIAGTGVACVIQRGFAAVAHKEQVTQHFDCVALLPFAEQGSHRHIKVLAQQVEQGRFNRGNGMDGGAQVKRLLAAATAVALGELLLHLLQDALVLTNRLSYHQRACVLQRLPNLLAAWHLAHAGAACAVGQYQQIACEEGAVGTAQVQEHAVAPGNGDNAQLTDQGGGGSSHESVEKLAAGRLAKAEKLRTAALVTML